jgi:hypothetical protein
LDKINLSDSVKEFKKSLKEFREFRLLAISKQNEISSENILSRLNQCVSEDLEELKNACDFNVSRLVGVVNYSKELQAHIANYTTEMRSLTEGLYNCIKKIKFI